MRLRGMAIAAVVALAACSGGGGGGGSKKGTVVVTGATNQQEAVGPTKTFAPRAGAVTVAAVGSTNPTKLALTVFKTELFDGTAWVTIFDSAQGAQVDLVSASAAAFGEGAVPVGAYGTIRFTVANQATFSAGALDACSAAVDQTFTIDGNATQAQMELYFATASQGGGASWTANGSKETPFLMSAPIDVRDAATTRVTLQFETGGTIACTSDGLAIPKAPQMKTYSVVVPKTQSFKGGDFWIAHYNMTGGDPALQADLGNAQGRADFRRSLGYNLGWGLKATFDAPTAKNGTVGILSLTGGMTEHRRRVDESGCTECGYQPPNGGDMFLLYTIDADRRVSFKVPDGPRIEGAFSEDFGTFIGATLEDRNSADLVFGVKVSPAQTLTGRYAWASQNSTLGYPSGSSIASFTYTNWSFGWAKFDGTSSPDLGQYISQFQFSNPTLPYGNGFEWSAGMKPVVGDFMPASVSIESTGVGNLAVQGVGTPQWTVATPDGHVMLTLGDTTASDVDPGADTKYDQNLAVMLKQAAPGTQSLATIAGRWTIVTRNNNLMNDNGDAVAFRGVQYGTITVALNGAASFEVVLVDDAGNVYSGSGTGKARVQKACIGRVGGAGEGGEKLAWNDASCAADGGEVLDVAVISDDQSGPTKDVAWFVVDETASVAAIVSTDGYDPATAANGPNMIGYMVRSSR